MEEISEVLYAFICQVPVVMTPCKLLLHVTTRLKGLQWKTQLIKICKSAFCNLKFIQLWVCFGNEKQVLNIFFPFVNRTTQHLILFAINVIHFIEMTCFCAISNGDMAENTCGGDFFFF